MSYIFTALILFIPVNAYAYIDPSTGSIVLQFLIAGLVTGLFVVKQFWFNIKSMFQRIFGAKPDNEP